MGLFAGLTAAPWKIATGGALALLLGVSVYTGVQVVENRRLTTMNSELDRKINDPESGLVVRLTKAQTDTVILKTTIERQTAQFKAKAAEDARVLASTRAALTQTQKDNRRLLADAARLTALPPQGDTVCQRLLDIDSRVQETLQ